MIEDGFVLFCFLVDVKIGVNSSLNVGRKSSVKPSGTGDFVVKVLNYECNCSCLYYAGKLWYFWSIWLVSSK